MTSKYCEASIAKRYDQVLMPGLSPVARLMRIIQRSNFIGSTSSPQHWSIERAVDSGDLIIRHAVCDININLCGNL